MNRKFNFALVVATLALLVSFVAHNAVAGAMVINGNLDADGTYAYNGPGVYPSSGTWNQITNADLTENFTYYPPVIFQSQNLLDSSGNPTGTTLILGGSMVDAPSTGISMLTGYEYSSDAYLAGVPAGSYDLYLYSMNGGNSNNVTTFTVNGSPGQVVDNTTVTAAGTTFVSGGNYTEFVGVVPASGLITIHLTNGTPSGQSLAGFQLVQLPEPSSFMLAGIGLVGATVVARSRKQAVAKTKAGRAVPNCLVIVLLAVLAATAAASHASAAPFVSLEFGSPSTVPGAAPGTLYWNGTYTGPGIFSNPTATNLLENDGVTGSGINFTFTGGYGGPLQGAGNAPFSPDILSFYGYGTAGFTISNAPGVWDVYLYSMNGGAHNESTAFTLNGSGPVVVDNTAPASTSSFVLGGNYTEFAGVTAVGGIITGTFTDGGNLQNSAFDGFQLVLVPEPSSFVLAGIGLVGAAVVARRRKQK